MWLIFITLAFLQVASVPGQVVLKDGVGVTVSAKTRNIIVVMRNLSLYPNGLIKLTNGRLEDSGTQTLLNFQPSQPNDWMTTGLVYDYTNWQNTITYNTTCYGYYVYYMDSVDNSKIYSYSCLRAYSNWMEQMKDYIGEEKLRDLFIPGSHDTGAYRYNFNPLSQETIVTKYTITQDADVLMQLKHGIRYLDLRPAYYPTSNPQWWINHASYQMQPLEPVLRQILDFIKNTNEIVVVAFGEFPVGFDNSTIHQSLVNFIKTIFQDQICTSTLAFNTPLKDIWASGKRLIINYGDSTVGGANFPYTWPGSYGRWGNKDTISGLQSYLYQVNSQIYPNDPKLTIDSAALTPQTWGVVFDTYGGLRKMADSSNMLINDWYFKDLGMNANVVVVDFFLTTKMVETAICYNMYKSMLKVNPNMGPFVCQTCTGMQGYC